MSLKVCINILFFVGLVTGEIKNKGWWRNTVFYQVYPRSFMDSDNDGIGDLKGITSKLEHFAESGIGGIWLSPIYTSPMIDFGYDISDFRDIDGTYGTLQDLEELTSKAKKLGIKVVLDFVPNHTSNKHYWFMQSYNGIGKYKDYYVWRKGRANNTQPPNNWISVFNGPAWTYNPIRDSWYLHQFDYRQPDLNYTNPYVRQEMEDVVKFWLSKGIDGFRIDAVIYFYENDKFEDQPRSYEPGVEPNDPKYLDPIYTTDDPRNYELIQSWRNVIDEWVDKHNGEEKVIMTEAYTSWDNTAKFYDYGVNVPFNFFLLTDITNTSKPSEIKKVIDDWMARTPSTASANWVLGNHDNPRLASRYPGRVDQMTMLTMVLPGVAVTYNGEEIGMEDNTNFNYTDVRDINRTPFQWDGTKNAGFSNASSTWLPVNQDYPQLNLAKQKSEPQSHYKLYQSLTKLRSTSEALKNGTLITEVLNDEQVLAVVRRTAGEEVVLLVNFSDDAPQQVDLTKYAPGANESRIVVASLGSGIKWGSSVEIPNVQLPPKATVVLSNKIRN